MKALKLNRWKAGVAALAVTAVLAVSSVAAYAEGYGSGDGSDIPEEGNYVDENGDFIQFEMTLEELGLTEADLLVPMGQIGGDELQYVNGQINAWSVPSGKTAKAGSFKKNVNDTIYVSVTIIPTNKTARAGIILPNGNAVCVQGQGPLSGIFTCPTTGYYWVFVKNMSDTTVIANGSYTY